jgi:Pin2-interacting protein X1
MGLAAPKQRIKLSQDPNNTRWTSDTSSFGHKIMSSQGWKPGQYLGAKDAPHAEFHTAANASHIRVAVKDDNLGIGAKVGSGVGHGECTGLDAFKNLLGRLNGKDEDEIEKEQKSREDLKRAIYTEKRWGSIRFVKGGFLIGDKIQFLIDGEAERVRKLAAGETSSSESDEATDSDETPEPIVEKKKSKKRKIEEVDDGAEAVSVKVKKSKKEKRKSAALPEGSAGATKAVEDPKVSKKESKRKRKIMTEAAEEDDEAEIKQRKKEKKHKKEKKEKKERSKATLDDESTKESKKKSKRDKKKREAESEESGRSSTNESTPATPVEAVSGRSTPMMQGRHAVRARNIAQKRLASMDVASLNQVSILTLFNSDDTLTYHRSS